MSDRALLLGADQVALPEGLLPPGILPLIFLGLAVLGLLLLLVLVSVESRRLGISRRALKVQILTHLQTSYPGAEADLELLPDEAGSYKDLTPDARETAKNYLDFCAERFYWWRAAQVDPAIWSGWERGMTEQFKRPALRVAWRERHARDLTYTQAFKDWVNRKVSG
jgi:hypothetical protein